MVGGKDVGSNPTHLVISEVAIAGIGRAKDSHLNVKVNNR
jgi:hypothetical protein